MLHAVAMQGQLPTVLLAALLPPLPMRVARVPHSAHELLSAVLHPVLLALLASAASLPSLCVMRGACEPRLQVLILNGSMYVKRAPEQDSFNFYAQSGAFLLFARVLCRWAVGNACSRLQPRLVQGSHGAGRAGDGAEAS